MAQMQSSPDTPCLVVWFSRVLDYESGIPSIDISPVLVVSCILTFATGLVSPVLLLPFFTYMTS